MKEDIKMKQKVEETIEAICDRIQKNIKQDTLSSEILDLSKAVNELANARVKM